MIITRYNFILHNRKIQLHINLHSVIEWDSDMEVANAWVIQVWKSEKYFPIHHCSLISQNTDLFIAQNHLLCIHFGN